jgi:hypothetical protein
MTTPTRALATLATLLSVGCSAYTPAQYEWQARDDPSMLSAMRFRAIAALRNLKLIGCGPEIQTGQCY